MILQEATMQGVNLDRSTVGTLALPQGKSAEYFWDRDLAGFALKLQTSTKGKLLKSYVIQYRVGGHQRRLKLGDANKLNADQARKKATELFARILLGSDPAGERTAAAAPVLKFADGVQQYLKLIEPTLRPASLKVKVLYLTSSKYFAPLHGLPLAQVTQSAVAKCLDDIRVNSGTSTCSQSRAHLSAFLMWALKRGHIPTNVCLATEKPNTGPARERVLCDAELAKVWNAAGDDPFGKIVRLLILTGCRRQEIGGLKWSEVNIDGGTITISAERSKNHRALELPLPAVAFDIIKSVPKSGDCLFGQAGFTGFEKAKAAFKDGIDAWNIHDIRRSVATGMAEIGTEPHVIEAILNHASGHKAGVAGTYNRAGYSKQMKTALSMWSDHISTVITGKRQSKVVAFKTG
jgi:integrase